MPIAYGYARVSHLDSAKSELSIPAQAKQIEAFYQYLSQSGDYPGLEWGGMYEDLAVSAFKVPFTKRERARSLDARLQRGDHVIFAKLDRAFRGVQDMLTTTDAWVARGVKIHFLDLGIEVTSANGRMLTTIIATVAEWFSRMNSERMRAVFKEMRAQGRPTTGMIPWGFKKVRRNGVQYIEPDPEQRQFMAWVVHCREQGLSYTQIIRKWEESMAPKEGRKPLPPGFSALKETTLKRIYNAEIKLRKREAEDQAAYDAMPEKCLPDNATDVE